MKIKSRDAYFEQLGSTLIIGTEKVEKQLIITENGSFIEKSFHNKITGKEYIQNGSVIADEFFVTVNNRYLSGNTGKWKLRAIDSDILSQEELKITISLIQDNLQVKRCYIAYPGQPILQEWTEYTNLGEKEIHMSRPSLFVCRMLSEVRENVDFSYMTGGACFTGSQMLKTVRLTEGYLKLFDSQKDPEIIEIDGKKGNNWHNRFNGTAIWNEFFVLTDTSDEEGCSLTFDYQGCWKAEIVNCDRNLALCGWCELINYPVLSGETIKIAPASFSCYAGDMDELGNIINDYIYTYKWDYTRDKYFNRTNLMIWQAAPLKDRIFKMVEAARYIGYERIWVDDFWFDAKGNWNGILGDDWNEINRYLKENNLIFRLWMPPWHADRLSKIWIEHPEWMLDFHGNWYNWTIDMSNEEAYQWILNMLCQKQKEFGTFDLRVDGDPCNLWNDGSFDTEDGNWNGTLKQSENFYRLYKEFKDKNPDAGIDGCSSGGHTLGIESARYVDQQQITDGWCYHIGGYWTTMFLPIDKHQGMPIAETNKEHLWENANESQLYLFGAPIDTMQEPEKGVSPQALEARRKNLELFYWLRAQGVYGRYIKVYRPETEHGDKTFILQRMTKDNKKGMIMISSSTWNPILGKSDRIFVKGLNPKDNYTIDSQLGGVKKETKKGSDWVKEGIFIHKVLPGEYIYINLPGRPGMNTLTKPPKCPCNLKLTEETWLGHKGIALRWEAPDEKNTISCYMILKNDTFQTKVSIGTFWFDTMGGLNDHYRICSVDYDGNMSDYIE